MNSDAMGFMDVIDMLREIKRETKLTQIELAEKLGSTQSTVGRWLAGSSEPTGKMRDNIKSLYSVTFNAQLIYKVPLMGFVGAGQAVYPIDSGAHEMVIAPEEARNTTVAVEIRGDSMMPWLEDGWLIYYSQQLPPGEMINRRCVAQLADGRLLVKTVMRGSQPGLWTLTSTNASTINDVAIEWVAPIDWIRPKY
jgi:transcriptional regulator with XRE-family HTH domain